MADVSREDAARKAVALTLQNFGKLDLLVNNAARIMSKLVVDMTLDDWNAIMSVNVRGAFLHSREAMKAMIPNKSGAIVNIASSHAAYFAFPQISAYTSSKGALVQLTRTLALEAIEHGVDNAVGSGDVVTNIWADKMENGRATWPITAAKRRSAAPPRQTRSPRSWPSWPRTGRVSSLAPSSWSMAA